MSFKSFHLISQTCFRRLAIAMAPLLVIQWLFFTTAVIADEVVIVHPSVNTTNVSQNTIRLLFSLRRTRWQNGQLVKVFVLNDENPVHIHFVKNNLGLFPRQLRRVWDRRIYSGTGQGPNQVQTVSDMLFKIAHEPGAIGYLPRSMITSSVKVLEVER